MRDKFALTRELIKNIKGDNSITFEQARSMWWYNLRQDGGLRLTTLGYFALVEDVELANYRYELKPYDIFNTRTIIELDHKLQMPYYIVSSKGFATHIIFFGSKEAMCARLYDNLQRFLTNYT
jgi:hypothetical protein